MYLKTLTMYQEFKSSLWELGPLLTPHKIVIDDNTVTWTRNNGWNDLFLSNNTYTILRKNISGVFLNGSAINGRTVVINSFGGTSIVAEHFTDYDAQRIVEILTQNETENSHSLDDSFYGFLKT